MSDANTICAAMAWTAREARHSTHVLPAEDAAVLLEDWRRAEDLGVRFGACFVRFGGHHWLIGVNGTPPR